MLQALLASGALFQGLKAELTEKVQRTVFMIACGVVALLFLGVGLMALAVASYFALLPHLGEAGSAALVGGVALLIGLIIIAIGTRDRSARAATSAASAPNNSPLPGVADAAANAPVPWLLGALILGLVLGKKS